MQLIRKIKSHIVSFGAWCVDNQDQIFMLGTIIEFVLILFLTLSLLIAFWLMGLYPKSFSFPLQIGVSAIATIAGGLGSMFALYKYKQNDSEAEVEKYKIDSTYNSISGQMPAKKGDI